MGEQVGILAVTLGCGEGGKRRGELVERVGGREVGWWRGELWKGGLVEWHKSRRGGLVMG